MQSTLEHQHRAQSRAQSRPDGPRRRPPIASAVVLTADGGHACVDRNFLRRAGVTRARTFHRADLALDYLRAHGAELVLLGDDLDDMTGLEFLRRVRRDKALAATPVLVASAAKDRRHLLDALEAGCSGYMVRPYSAHTFARHLLRAKRGAHRDDAARQALARARRAMADEAPAPGEDAHEPLSTRSDIARKLLETGRGHLGAGRPDDAIEAFQRALGVDADFAEAHLGLSDAWRARGFPDKARLHARLAARCYLRLGRRAEARRIFTDVLGAEPEGGTPWLDAADSHIRSGRFDEAALAAAKALTDGPEAECHARLKRACHFTADPVGAARSLAEALSREPGMPTAETLARRIMGDARAPRPEAETVRPGQDGVGTAACEWWAVVKYVWQVFVTDSPLPRTMEPLEI